VSTGEVRLPWICPAVTGLACRYKGNLKTQIARYFRKFPIWAIDGLYKSPPDLDIERFGDAASCLSDRLACRLSHPYPPPLLFSYVGVFCRLLHRSHFGSQVPVTFEFWWVQLQTTRPASSRHAPTPSLYSNPLYFSPLRIWHYFGAHAHRGIMWRHERRMSTVTHLGQR
jgi:hypothetical protein